MSCHIISYIMSYHIIYLVISYIIPHIVSFHIISYIILCHVISYLIVYHQSLGPRNVRPVTKFNYGGNIWTLGSSYRASSMLYNKSYQQMRIFCDISLFIFPRFPYMFRAFTSPSSGGIFSCCLCATTWFM